MNISRKKLYQNAADILTLLCAASTVILILFLFMGPKEGMEAMIIILPWMFAGGVHVLFGLAALFCAFKSGSHVRNLWIYIYFFIFFGFNAYYLAIVNQADVAIARKIDDITRPGESELHQLLRQQAIGSMSGKSTDPVRQKRVRQLVQEGADVSYLRPGDRQPLIVMAARTGDTGLVEMMLEKGADVNGPVKSSQTPLMAAVKGRHAPLVELLLKAGARPDDTRYKPNTPLMVAAGSGDAPTVKVLLESGADPDARTSSSPPPLIRASAKGNAETVKLLLDHGADANTTGFGRIYPLINAIKSECVECVRLLVDAGATSHGKTSRNETALVLAVQQDRKKIVEILAESKKRPGSFHDLHMAVKTRDMNLLASLLSLNVSPDAPDDRGYTMLSRLAMGGRQGTQSPELDVAAARLLIAHGADIEAKGQNGQTALILASKSGALEMVRLLIEHGADLNASTRDGRTPLLNALWGGHKEIAADLIKAGADPNTPVQWGPNRDFPLRAAVVKKDPELVRLLLDGGAKIDPETRDLCDLLQKAAASPEIVNLLIATGVDLNRKDPLNRYPLSVIIQYGTIESTIHLINAGAEPMLPEWRGKQPFFTFVETGKADLVRLCLKRSRQIRQDSQLLKKAMYWAIRKAHPDVVRVLMEEGVFYTRLAEVKAILKWAKVPPATPENKKEIYQLFKARIGKQQPKKRSPGGSPILILTPQQNRS